MRIKFEATDTTGKVHKRGSKSQVYSHCVVIHFAEHLPSRSWPEGIAAFSHAEWAGSRALAEHTASRWRKKPYVEAIEILGRGKCDAFRKIKGHELASCFSCEA